MIKTDGIILDIDGTLWNTTGVVAKAWNKAIADCGFDAALVNASGLQKEFGKPMNVIADDLWPALSQEQKEWALYLIFLLGICFGLKLRQFIKCS